MNTARLLVLTREIAELNQILSAEAARTDPSRGFVEAHASRLLKRAAEAYVAALPDPSAYSEVKYDPRAAEIFEIWGGRKD